MKKYIFVLIILLTIIGGLLRFYKITKNPPSLTGDEISFGYAAYSIMQTGKDESGKHLPLVIKSIGDYKNPLPAYLMVLSLKIFGVNDFGIRFNNALSGTLAIPIFFLFLVDILKNRKIALVGAILLTFSAWNIHYSRFAYEPLMASLFTLVSIWFFIKMLGGEKKWAFLSALFLVLTMYTAFAPRLFIPIFVVVALAANFSFVKKYPKTVFVFFLSSLILGIPLLYVSLSQGASTRLSMVLLSNDVELSRHVILTNIKHLSDYLYLFFFWLKRYLSYLEPEFIFINGLNMTLPGNIGLGLLYLFELPLLILGGLEFIKNKIPYKNILTIWLLTGIVPDSITNNLQHSGRLLHVAPVIYLIIALGIIKSLDLLKKMSNVTIRMLIAGGYALFTLTILLHAFLVFSVHFPRQKGESFDEGLREVIYYINANGNKYDSIVFDIRRGIEGPYLVSNPHMYLLFYSKYDPLKYQTIAKYYSSDKNQPFYRFDKYEFRYINWPIDSKKNNTLFIGSPWSFPENITSSRQLKAVIKMKNGLPAFYIVSSN